MEQCKCLCIVFACIVECMTRNIADDNSRCCDCRECKETYARRSKLARHLNVSDGVSTRHHAENVTHGQKAMIYYIVMNVRMVKMLHSSSTMEIQGTHRHNSQLRRSHVKSNYAVMVKLLQVAYGTTYSHFASNSQGILCI